MPLQINGATSGSTTIQATDAVTATLTLPSSTGTLISTSSSDRVIPSAALPVGTVLQVQSVYYTSDTQLASSGAMHELTSNLRISFTPKSDNSKLYFECFGSFVFPNSGNLQYAQIYDLTNSAVVSLPPASGSRNRCHWMNRTSPYDPNDADNMYFSVSVSNTSTTSRTYTIYHGTEGAASQFLVSSLSTVAGGVYPLTFKITEVAL